MNYNCPLEDKFLKVICLLTIPLLSFVKQSFVLKNELLPPLS